MVHYIHIHIHSCHIIEVCKYVADHFLSWPDILTSYSRIATGFRKTDPNRTFGISRITNLNYLTHCESLLLHCSHAIFAV